jgi:hypothetical protein
MFVLGLFALGLGSAAAAPCRINSAAALICTTPVAAADAFQRFGRDPRDLKKDYIRQLARAEGCARLSDYPDFAAHPILFL